MTFRSMNKPLLRSTWRTIRQIYGRLDYDVLGPVYCDEGGDKFWRAKRGPSMRIGTRLAGRLKPNLARGGRSLYVGAGVAEIAPLMVEVMELRRTVSVHNLRATEVLALNEACGKAGVSFNCSDGSSAPGTFDHIWMVSVVNDPERFPELSALSYGRAEPLHFDPARFATQRRTVRTLVRQCLAKLRRPGFVTTTTEEAQWIAEWCHMRSLPYCIRQTGLSTATVGDPVCFIRVE